jgi:hypothetical protein
MRLAGYLLQINELLAISLLLWVFVSAAHRNLQFVSPYWWFAGN